MSGKTNRCRYERTVAPDQRREVEFYKRLAADVVFGSPQLRQLSFKGDRLLTWLFEAFRGEYIDGEPSDAGLLPGDVERAVRAESSEERRARLICDYIAGMTDGFAVRTYKRLFDPEFGSIADLV